MTRRKIIVPVGFRSGLVSVVGHVDDGQRLACRCDCGVEFVALKHNVFRGLTSSCGCARRASLKVRNHARAIDPRWTGTPELATWKRMHSRCSCINLPDYPRYGGRGIRVCDRWSGPGGFARFIEDMGPRPSPDHSIDRIDVNGNYEPGNCRWADDVTQARNKRNSALELHEYDQILWLAERGYPNRDIALFFGVPTFIVAYTIKAHRPDLAAATSGRPVESTWSAWRRGRTRKSP